MKGFAVWLAALSLALSACAGSAYPSAVPGTTDRQPFATLIRSGAIPSATASVAPSPSAATTLCPGRTWPPYPLSEIPGIAAVSTDRATIELTNRTGRTYYYRVSGWQLDQFETCRALGELEVQRGPIAPRTTERVMVDPGWLQAGVRVTVAFWDKPCGETCQREPLAAMIVGLSPLEPAAS
jgi:hypothetical protein